MTMNDREVLEWVKHQIEGCRLNAMHAYNRNDIHSFENINVKIRYFERIAEILEEKAKQDEEQ